MPNLDVLGEECCNADDVVQATVRARAQARDKLVETDDRVLNIAEVLIHVHRLPSQEHVQELHAIEDKHLRAHNGSLCISGDGAMAQVRGCFICEDDSMSEACLAMA